ncbi:hypothetical protein [Acidovorax sp. SUPP3334]|uniref:hypothetical protein n=1 Tax=Acidovorax sp. SUPP3334 TaxID=2920881 RepID=UPI0023DE34D2|nr:hypothetical protein AVHM3334_22150 [Acidovorax sp. SUPP3334]
MKKIDMDMTTLPAAALPPLHFELAERQQRLAGAAAQLKAELFGIDEVIDRVIDSVRAWYVLPQCITRPVDGGTDAGLRHHPCRPGPSTGRRRGIGAGALRGAVGEFSRGFQCAGRGMT